MRRKTLGGLLVIAAATFACGGDTEGDRSAGLEPSAGSTPAEQPLAPSSGQPYPDVTFDNPGVNPFVDVEDDALSTFALDVDTGSYTIARRFLRDGNRPDKDSVRVEEFVNFFEQEYRSPRDATFAIHIDGAPTPYTQNARSRVVRVGVKAVEVSDRRRQDAALTFVVDTSGSMAQGSRLELVQDALTLLVGELRPRTRVALVEYGSRARVVLEATPVLEGDEIRRAIGPARAERLDQRRRGPAPRISARE